MDRINVFNEERELIGWFDKSKARCFDEDQRFDGHNMISVATGSQWHHEALYRTAGGRWVLYRWSNYQGIPDNHDFVSDEQARTWLLVNDHDDIVKEFFGEIEEEKGPGRPEIEPAIHVRLSPELLEALDREAQNLKKTRAETIRQLLSQAFLSK